jgi:hypothetical protein
MSFLFILILFCVEDNLLTIICLCMNNLQIGDIVCNLELLPCIVKGHFEVVLHLHIYINLEHFACIMLFFFK